MNGLEQQPVGCPYCGETIEVLIDPGDAGTSYIEDCQVCCRPILFRLSSDAEGALSVEAAREDD